MIDLFWRLAARFLARPAVTAWLIRRAIKTPYHHLASADGSVLYMARYWLFNPYDRVTHKVKHRWCPWSIRLHLIHREDQDRHMHDHPWNARTIILRGGYQEQVPLEDRALRLKALGDDPAMRKYLETAEFSEYVDRLAGHTGRLAHGQYHRIHRILGDHAVTLFTTGPYRGPWGFLVAGKKVPWREYLGLEEGQDLVSASAAPQPVGMHAMPLPPECSRSPTGEHDFEARAADGGALSMSQPVIHICQHCGDREDD